MSRKELERILTEAFEQAQVEIPIPDLAQIKRGFKPKDISEFLYGYYVGRFEGMFHAVHSGQQDDDPGGTLEDIIELIESHASKIRDFAQHASQAVEHSSIHGYNTD